MADADHTSVLRSESVDFMELWRQFLQQWVSHCCPLCLREALCPEKGSDPGGCEKQVLSSATVTQRGPRPGC